jgi:ubiquinone/menaquinone biosynthesis C-methylase UbiE
VDDPPLSLVGGEPLTPEVAQHLPANAPVRLMADRRSIPPVDEGDIVEVLPRAAGRPGDIVLCIRGGQCELARVIGADGPRVAIEAGSSGDRIALPADAVLGLATGLETGDLLFDLGRGRWRVAGRLAAALPPSFGGLLIVLARVERLRRPFFPPLFMGGAHHLLTRLAAAYDTEAEVTDRETDLLPEERLLLEHHLTRARRLLDVGCGTGREAIGFARAGLEVVGIDVAPAMIARARERARAAGLDIEFAVGDALTWPAAGAPFDAIYFSPGIYSHIPGRDRRVRTLARLRRLLGPGGLIVTGPILGPPLPFLSRTRLVDSIRRIGRCVGVRGLAEPGDHLNRGHALERAPAAHRYVHRFRNRAEAEAEMADAGLVVTDRLDETSWIVRPRA